MWKVAELVRLKVNVIVAGGAPAILAAKHATETIPIIMVATAERMRARCNEQAATIGLTFIRAASVFTTLSRYEATIERSYYRALHELQRLQHARLGGRVPPPLALDVTVSGRHDGEPDGSGSASRQSDKSEPRGGAEGHGPAAEVTEKAIEDELFK